MFLQIPVCVMVVGVVMARPHPDSPPHHSGPPSYGPPPPAPYYPPEKQEPPKPYAFDYGVKDSYSGSNYGHKENSDGEAVTGSYQVALPDGRIQTVTYTADHYNGFQAQVSYEGSPQYPEHPPQTPYNSPHRPSYKESPDSPPVPSEPLPQAPHPPVYHPPVYQGAPSSVHPLVKEEEAPLGEQVYIEQVDLPDTVYRDQLDK